MRRSVAAIGIFCLFISLMYECHATCVFASEFGFTLNCAFKKSGLFRVRNLGGVKAHFGLGFSVGDELGLNESLTNQDPSKRRSTNVKNGAPPNAIGEVAVQPATQTEKRGKQNRLIVKQPSVPSGIETGRAQRPVIVMDVPKHTLARPLPANLPPFKPLPAPKEETLKVLPMQPVSMSKGPGLAYPTNQQTQISKMLSQMPSAYDSNVNQQRMKYVPTAVTAFVPMPPPKTVPFVPNMMSITQPMEQRPYPIFNDNIINKSDDDINTIGYDDDPAAEINEKIIAIAKAANISMEAVEAAIVLRQQQLLNQYANIPMPTTTSTTTTTTTTTHRPTYTPEPFVSVTNKRSPPPASTSGKVMNAPREYYPIGYEKNFDDKFESKVELPDTSFYCGDQKYFPGLYGDENLGCMVFHVCALTDDGLVMKSFLCPESTLFDQTILKCNWWFYVDCKNTQALYDTNIPVSKSYQLMKALTFFSNYKKELENDKDKSSSPEEDNMEGVKKAISILEEQSSPKTTSDPIMIVTPKTAVSDQQKIPRFSVSRQNRNKNINRASDSFGQSSQNIIKIVKNDTNNASNILETANNISKNTRFSAKDLVSRNATVDKDIKIVNVNEIHISNITTDAAIAASNISNNASLSGIGEVAKNSTTEKDRKRVRYSLKRSKNSTYAPKASTTVRSKRRRTTARTSSTTPYAKTLSPKRKETAAETVTKYPLNWNITLGDHKNEELSKDLTTSLSRNNSKEDTSTYSQQPELLTSSSTTARSTTLGGTNALKAALQGEKIFVVKAEPMTEFEKQYNKDLIQISDGYVNITASAKLS